MPKVKICGITNHQDALWAANLGADFIGLNFYPGSPRKVSIKHAMAVVDKVPGFISVVGVFVDEPILSVKKIVEKVPLRWVQLHGAESPEYCAELKALRVQIIKVLRLTKPLEAADVDPYSSVADYFMFDTYSPEVPGGTGESFNWDWLQSAAALSKPWFLAGGLTPGNILEAIKTTHPPCVDVCSGVEKSPTRKDYEAMKTFIQAAKSIR
jgi:phosphoribosylanthranilate isomerase